MPATGLQATIYAGYGTAAAALGAETFGVFRGAADESASFTGSPLFTLPAQFTNSKVAGYNFDRSYVYDDVTLAGLFDATNCQQGDYLVGQISGRIFFIIGLEPMLPIVCVQANRTVSLTRTIPQAGSGGPGSSGPSQPGGQIPYWGRTEAPSANSAPITAPACMIASAGRATSRSDMPSAAPGPSRWRIYVSAGTFPKGAIHDRDFLTDEEGNRHQVEAAGWTNLGYRLESIRVEL